MEEYKMSSNTKLEVAVEILSAMIAKTSEHGENLENPELKKLLKERELMYSDDEKTIDKIINEYGPILKKEWE